MKKSTFNINKAEGERDGKTLNGYLLCIKFETMKRCKELYKNSPILASYEQNYQEYKQAFLIAYWQTKRNQS